MVRIYRANIFLMLLSFSTAACGPRLSSNSRSEVATNHKNSDDNQQARRAAFSAEDISKIAISPTTLSFEPWTFNKLRLFGTFPDDSQGSVSDGIAWSIKTGDTDQIALDSENGVVLSKATGSYVVQAKWKGHEAETKIDFKFIAGSALSEVPNPFSFEVKELSPTSVKLSWDLPAEFVSGFAIAFNKGTAPSYCIKADQPELIPPVVSTVQYVADVLPKDKLDYTITGLVAGSTYVFRICSLQSVKLGDKVFERKSAGTTKSEELSP